MPTVPQMFSSFCMCAYNSNYGLGVGLSNCIRIVWSDVIYDTIRITYRIYISTNKKSRIRRTPALLQTGWTGYPWEGRDHQRRVLSQASTWSHQ